MALLVFNVIDAVCTMTWVANGLATEANPVMAAALEGGPASFLAAKLALVGLAVGILWRHSGRSSVRLMSLPLTALYAAVVVFHAASSLRMLAEAHPVLLAYR